ncbi:FbpB family small basic protein [Mesobacillus subterraneus]|uniref:FbpB family small basic protein n=1 Tax=Mesobacillus subterraneus TaxID=285983 RepID=A0A427TQT2_9BACI|nr:FbpB family small basic protein [Mesobacillus subterraneus]RSD26656.1 FbpB family small basic protein [Mesobacillus subterraneus]
MMKKKLSFDELVKKNKEELLADQQLLEKIEKRLDEKYTKPKK